MLLYFYLQIIHSGTDSNVTSDVVDLSLEFHDEIAAKFEHLVFGGLLVSFYIVYCLDFQVH